MASVSPLVLFLLSHFLTLHSAEAGLRYNKKCPPFRCGNLQLLTFPFANTSNPECGVFTVDCGEMNSTILLERGGTSYKVPSISQNNTLQVLDEEVSKSLRSHICVSFTNLTFPGSSLTNLAFPSSSFFSVEIASIPNQTVFYKCKQDFSLDLSQVLPFGSCGDSHIYYNYSNPSFTGNYSGCSMIQLPIFPQYYGPFDYHFGASRINLQVHVSEECYNCFYEGGQCRGYANEKFYCDGANKGKNRLVAMQLALGTLSVGIGAMLVAVCCFKRKFLAEKIIYFWKRKSLTHQAVQAFLRDHEALAIKQYNYSDVKKITNSFKEKLGEGGYGSVYKGMLKNGHLIAVKVLKKSKDNGEEYINEVVSISRTSHVNIVSLMGFCFEGSKRALIYEFMPNGSLDKFIYKTNASKDVPQLEWEVIYKIALGIARGLEYLHRGCDTQILHFDIKPHNILLDENFCPKISDFGLAKICPREQSIVSMLGARGTIGYIAPEVFCRSFGGISHKSDVYSYGMLIFEMIGRRRDIEVGVDHTSEIFFPYWIYKRLEQGENLGLQGLMNESDHESTKKMIIVSLWCIQTHPSNRPSMNGVVNMLECSEPLQVPPKPYLSSPSRSLENPSTTVGSLQYDSIIT